MHVLRVILERRTAAARPEPPAGKSYICRFTRTLLQQGIDLFRYPKIAAALLRTSTFRSPNRSGRTQTERFYGALGGPRTPTLLLTATSSSPSTHSATSAWGTR